MNDQTSEGQAPVKDIEEPSISSQIDAITQTFRNSDGEHISNPQTKLNPEVPVSLTEITGAVAELNTQIGLLDNSYQRYSRILQNQLPSNIEPGSRKILELRLDESIINAQRLMKDTTRHLDSSNSYREKIVKLNDVLQDLNREIQTIQNRIYLAVNEMSKLSESLNPTSPDISLTKFFTNSLTELQKIAETLIPIIESVNLNTATLLSERVNLLVQIWETL